MCREYWQYDTPTWPNAAHEELAQRLQTELGLRVNDTVGSGPYLERTTYSVAIRRITHLTGPERFVLKRKADLIHLDICEKYKLQEFSEDEVNDDTSPLAGE